MQQRYELDEKSQQEVDAYVANVVRQKEELAGATHEMGKGINSIFQSPENENIIQWQLDLQEQLDNIGHSLRGHVIASDENGIPCWKEADDKDDVIFTEYGVQEILRFLVQYLNKNTILSNYDEETINFKVHDAGNEFVDLVFLRYEKFFYVTPTKELLKENPDLNDNQIKAMQLEERKEKIKHFPIASRPIIDAIHSAYLRALNGGERESLRSARILTQTENPMMNSMMQQPMQQQKKFSVLKPTSWF